MAFRDAPEFDDILAMTKGFEDEVNAWLCSLMRLFTPSPDRLMGGFLLIPACGRCQFR